LALQGSRCAHKTLRAWEQDVLLKAKYWQKQKLARLAEYEDLQVRPSDRLGQNAGFGSRATAVTSSTG
jgi:hypothetical protein